MRNTIATRGSGVLRDFAFTAAFALIITCIGFTRQQRNDVIAEHQAATQLALAAAANGDTPTTASVATVREEIGPHPFLPTRFIQHSTLTERRLEFQPIGATNLDDKATYDATSRALRTGTFREQLPDGRWIEAIVIAPQTVRVAISTAVAKPPFPWLQLGGGVALALLVVMTALRAPRRYAGVIIASAIAMIAMPLATTSEIECFVAVVGLGAITGALHSRGTTMRWAEAIRDNGVAYSFFAPTAAAMTVLVIVPFAIGLAIGFFDHHRGEWSFVGLRNFGEVLSGGGHSLSDPLNFWFVLGVTVLWTLVNVLLAVGLGVGLALLLSQRWLRYSNWYRMLLILPWAIPNYITALIWKGMFAGEYGALNSLLDWCGFDRVSWFSSWSTSFFANVATNTWLGFPFMMVVAIGAIQAIPADLYEAAHVDGASPVQRFFHITLPHLRTQMAPAIALGAIWTFNMFSVIYLVSDGAPGGSTNILVTDAYRWAFERGDRYGMASAYATIIFVILLLWTLVRGRSKSSIIEGGATS